MAELFSISGTESPNRAGDVVFVHGIGGNATSTWSDDPAALFWPKWVGEDFPDWGVWCISYPASLSEWRGDTMHLPDRATNLLDLLHLHGLGSRPVCVVAHSMGGLVVAQMLRNATTYGRRYRPFGDAVQGLVFLATPLKGSFWADVCERAKSVFRPSKAMDDLKRRHPYVADLGRWFQDYLDTHPDVECALYCETNRTFGITVVDTASADPGLPRIPLVSLDEDHISIAKPKERTSHVYCGVRRVLDSLNGRIPQDRGAGRGTVHPGADAATKAMRRVADAARTTLESHVLPRIARTTLHASIFSPIAGSLRSAKPRIVAIVGPAGVGKTVMLGHIYDGLLAARAAWVAVVRCSDVQAALQQPERLASAFGLVATGTERSIVDVAEEASRLLGTGAVLIDTLDAILAPSLVPWLRQVFEGLVAAAATVVFTCREHEYELLEPLQDRFPGLSAVIDRRSVPVFAYPAEVREAALGFVQSRPEIDEHRGDAFVEGMMGLAADSVRLQEITQSPLLLALLCDLFGKEGYVPPDLTVSQLWERFWHEKVARGRQAGAPLQLGREKEKLGIELARTLFSLSDETVCLSMYEVDFELPSTSIANEAWNELLSEGVVKREAPSGRVRFFHQTLLEYAVARYLTGRRGKADLEDLLERAASAPLGGRRLHLWPILRQVLAIADTPECTRCLAALDRKALPAFRAAVFAITSRGEPALLRQVCDWALQEGAAYQKVFLLALHGASGALAPAALDSALRVLRSGDRSIASAATVAAGNLILRWGPRLPERRVADVMDAIRESSPVVAEVNTLLGRLLRTLAEAPKPRDRQELLTLRSRYATLPATLRHQVIKLHLAPDVDAAERTDLLPLAAGLPLGGSDERDDALALVMQTLTVAELLERLVASDTQHTWISVFATAVGRAASRDDAVVQTLMKGLCAPGGFVPARSCLALIEAIREGAADGVCDRLLATPVDSLAGNPPNVDAVATVSMALATVVDEQKAKALSEHIGRLAEESGGVAPRMVAARLLLGSGSPELDPALQALVAGLPVPQRRDCLAKYIQAAPDASLRMRADDLEAMLLDGCLADARGRRLYVDVCRVRARHSREAAVRLIELAGAESKSTANAAAAALVAVIEQGGSLNATQLLPMARSRYEGVRQHWSRALLALIDRGQPISEEELITALRAFAAEGMDDATRHNGFELARRWALQRDQVPQTVVVALELLMARSMERSPHMGAQIGALKAIAWNPAAEALQLMRAQAIRVAMAADLQLVKNGEHEFADVLTAVARHDRSILSELALRIGEMPPRNVRSLIVAIRRVEGKNAPLLSAMLSSEACPKEAYSLILSFHGA